MASTHTHESYARKLPLEFFGWMLGLCLCAAGAFYFVLLNSDPVRTSFENFATATGEVAAKAGPALLALPKRAEVPESETEQALRQLNAIGVAPDGAHLRSAAHDGLRYQAELLLRAGIDVNSADPDGKTALMAAAERRSPDMVDFLMEKGARVELATPAGATALEFAITAGRTENAERLIAHGADEGSPRIFAAALRSKNPFLIERFLAPLPSTLEWTPLTREAYFAAIQRGDLPTLKLLTAKHPAAPTLAPDGSGQSLLAYTIAWNDLEHARLLLEAGTNPNLRLSIPVEPHFLSIISGKRMPHYLSDEQGMTPLMLAAGLAHDEMVGLLLDHGADKNLRTSSKYKLAALNFASWADAVPSMQRLLGVNPGAESARVKISISSQKAWYYINDVVVFSSPVSTGKRSHPTPKGDFVVTDKVIKRKSTLYDAEMPFFMRLSGSEVGMHAGVVPGYPASHGCIRFPKEKARALYSQMQLGTLVSIVD